MAALPDEIILCVLALLPHDDRLTCLRVCRQWRRVGVDRTLWPPRILNPDGAREYSLLVAALLANACRDATDDDPEAVAARLTVDVRVDRYDTWLNVHGKEWLAKSRLTPAVSGCTLDSLPPADAGRVLEALHGRNLTRLEWRGAFDQTLLSTHLPRLPSLTHVSLSHTGSNISEKLEMQEIRERGIFHTLLQCATERWTLQYDTDTPYRFDLPNKAAASCQLSGLILGRHGRALNIEANVFTARNFPNLRVLDLRENRDAGEAQLFLDQESIPPLLEELSIGMSARMGALRYTYPHVKRLHFYAQSESERLGTTPWRGAAQFPALEEVTCYTRHWNYQAGDFTWWVRALDPLLGPANLCRIRQEMLVWRSLGIGGWRLAEHLPVGERVDGVQLGVQGLTVSVERVTALSSDNRDNRDN